MAFDAMFVVNSILFGVGLAMDAFSVSIANGLNEPEIPVSRSLVIAGTFAVFQTVMPLLGWFCIHSIEEAFQAFQPFIPWIALILLCWIGGKMLIEGLREKSRDPEEGEPSRERLTAGALFWQGVATSIDALSVGFTISSYDWRAALTASAVIAAVTFVICLGGLKLGKLFGTKLSGRASVLGGCILIAIGVEILVKSMI